MKQARLILCFCVALLALCLEVSAQTNMVNYGQNNGTNASTVVNFNNIYLPQQTFQLQFGPITNNPAAWGGGSYTTNGMTNAIAALWQVSIDPANSNWVTLAIMHPFGTNGEYDTFALPGATTNLYQRLLIVTTNPLPVGAWKPAP